MGASLLWRWWKLRCPKAAASFVLLAQFAHQGLALVTSVIAFDGWFCISFASKQRW